MELCERIRCLIYSVGSYVCLEANLPGNYIVAIEIELHSCYYVRFQTDSTTAFQ